MTLPIQTLNAIDSIASSAIATEVLIKRARQGRFRFYGWEYATAKVTRVTKARIFVKGTWEGASEREFNRSDLIERSGEKFNRAELIVDPELIAKARAEEAAEKARRALEQNGLVALLGIRKLFDEDAIKGRSDGEIQALIAAAADLGVL